MLASSDILTLLAIGIIWWQKRYHSIFDNGPILENEAENKDMSSTSCEFCSKQ